MKRSTLLELDGVGNLLLGIPLLVFPRTVSSFLGLTAADATLYPVVLGAVFVGIGGALLMERFKPSLSGLGLGGAMAINLVFGVALFCWLLFGQVALPLRGALVLWGLAAILVAIGLAEVFSLGAAAHATRLQAGGASPRR